MMGSEILFYFYCLQIITRHSGEPGARQRQQQVTQLQLTRQRQQTKTVTARRVSGQIAKELRDRNQANIAASHSSDSSQDEIR
jgi:hypothetical protein